MCWATFCATFSDKLIWSPCSPVSSRFFRLASFVQEKRPFGSFLFYFSSVFIVKGVPRATASPSALVLASPFMFTHRNAFQDKNGSGAFWMVHTAIREPLRVAGMLYVGENLCKAHCDRQRCTYSVKFFLLNELCNYPTSNIASNVLFIRNINKSMDVCM
jgi:hypothetical protein